MEAGGTLEVIAEIAIAFAGFAGIVGALAGTKLGPDHPSVWLPFWCMIEFSLGTLFSALLPVVVHQLGASEQLTWVVSSGVVGAFLVCHFLFVTPHFVRAQRQGGKVSLILLDVPIAASLVLALCFLTMNAFGVILKQSAGGFLLGLYALLVTSGLNFAYLMYVLVRPETGTRAV